MFRAVHLVWRDEQKIRWWIGVVRIVKWCDLVAVWASTQVINVRNFLQNVDETKFTNILWVIERGWLSGYLFR